MFSVIEGEKTVNKHNLYYKAYCRVLDSYENSNQDIRPAIKKSVFLGAKAIATYKKPETLTQEEAEFNFQFADLIRAMMAALTPLEFVNLFPITKEYDGKRLQLKDYFYTRDYIKGLDQNKPIGTEIDHFLWSYHNGTISRFVVNLMSFTSDLRRLDGQLGIFEEWADNNGLKSYTMHTDHKSKQYLFDKETGKTTRVRKAIPKYLKPIK